MVVLRSFSWSSLCLWGATVRDVLQEFWCGCTLTVGCLVALRTVQAVTHCFSPAAVATVFGLSWTPALSVPVHRCSSVCLRPPRRPVFCWSTLLLALLVALLDCPCLVSLFSLGSAWPDCPTSSLCSFSPRVLGWTVPSVRALLMGCSLVGFSLVLCLLGCPCSPHILHHHFCDKLGVPLVAVTLVTLPLAPT